jgi:putative ATP-dependent endonuclease of the OLD family
MRITQLRITNYRSFDETGINLAFPDAPSPVAIIGPNNAGKTNLLSALLLVTAARSTYPTAFSEEDFHGRNISAGFHIQARIAPPLRSANAYNRVTEMPLVDLVVRDRGGGIETSHYCLDAEGKQVFNPRTLKRSKTSQLTPEEKEALAAYQKTGAEQVHKWKGQLPVFYLGPDTLQKEIRPGRFSLLGKLVETFIKEFSAEENVMREGPGVVSAHVGRPRSEVYTQAQQYLERHVLSTPAYAGFVAKVQQILQKQLNLREDECEVRLRPPEADLFFSNLHFSVREASDCPLLPMERMGTGFISLFVVALLRAMIDTDEGGKIILLDEPETFLHEHFQEYFFEVLRELARKNQIIYTTHSKKFVDPFDSASIVRLERSSGVSVVRTAARPIEYPDHLEGYRLHAPTDYPKFLRTLEPNLGNLLFAERVVAVERPHDLLAYRTILEKSYDFGLNNTALVAAWGKDSLVAIIQLCQAFCIPVFVIHDADLPTLDPLPTTASAAEKGQATKNATIARSMGGRNIHINVPNLEGVLEIPSTEKSAEAVFVRVAGLTLPEAMARYPRLIPASLCTFLDLTVA